MSPPALRHELHAFLNERRDETRSVLTSQLSEYASKLAKDDGTLRVELGHSRPSIWPTIQRLWNLVEDFNLEETDKRDNLDLALALTRFTRNIVAGDLPNQESAFQCEPSIRKLIHKLTSYSAINEVRLTPLTAFLAQTLINVVTSNQRLTAALWKLYLRTPEEKNILTRLISAPSPQLASAAMVLVINCTKHNQEQSVLVASGDTLGPRVCICILDCIAAHFKPEDETNTAGVFDLGYSIFAIWFGQGLAADLWKAITLDDEVVTPHQTVYLKLTDAYLREPINRGRFRPGTFSYLLPTLTSLVHSAREAIHRALGDSGIRTGQLSPGLGDTAGYATRGYEDRPLAEVDLLLPKICEALVLVTQSLTTLILSEHEHEREDGSQRSAYFYSSRLQHGTQIEELIDLLRLLERFLPRIWFGRAQRAPHQAEAVGDGTDPAGFAYVKRDVLRLIGTVCHERRAQDRVRTCGGIPVILNMCVVDERNPYLREHALFAMRNLLVGNLENQAAVQELEPQGKWGPDDMLPGVGTAPQMPP